MGNSPSSSSGALSIVLDPPQTPNASYIAGRTLSGSVFARSTSNVQSPVRVEAYITGKERTRVRYTETYTTSDGKGGHQTHTRTRYRNAERSIYRVTVNLGAVNDVQAGSQFRFPFQVQLPPDLPSSMSTSRNGGYCMINYKFKAHVSNHHKVEQLFNVMSAPLSMQPVPNLIPPIVKNVEICGCFNRGSITMGARVANTRIGRGETAIIDFACKNQSRQRITKVEVDVKQEVHWSAGAHREYYKDVISYRLFNRTERWGEMTKDEVKAMQQSSKDKTQTYRDRTQQTLQMIHTAIFDGDNRVLLNIPADRAFQTYYGSLIQISHRMKIKINMDGSCMSNPTIKLPLQIGTPTSYGAQIASQPGQPSSPPVVSAVAIPMPSAPPLQSEPEIDLATPSAPPAEWQGAVTASPVVVGYSTAIVGGTATDFDGENGTAQETAFLPLAEVVPSLNNLINEIKCAVSPKVTVQKYMSQTKWDPVFTNMTPIEYSSVIKAVAIEFDQPDIAALVGSAKGANFTHQYVIAAIRVVSDWLRTSTLTKLLPLCKDLHQNVEKIKDELTDWEKVCTQRDFEQALAMNN